MEVINHMLRLHNNPPGSLGPPNLDSCTLEMVGDLSHLGNIWVAGRRKFYSESGTFITIINSDSGQWGKQCREEFIYLISTKNQVIGNDIWMSQKKVALFRGCWIVVTELDWIGFTFGHGVSTAVSNMRYVDLLGHQCSVCTNSRTPLEQEQWIFELKKSVENVDCDSSHKSHFTVVETLLPS